MIMYEAKCNLKKKKKLLFMYGAKYHPLCTEIFVNRRRKLVRLAIIKVFLFGSSLTRKKY